ncbi:DNA polymerase ligase N-terminal domain-containing protein [Streptomyces sp. NPDC059718]
MHFGFRSVPTEDHPPERADSKGVLAAGEYGGGTVIAWDEGGCRPLADGPFARALEHGHASFRLDGSKLPHGRLPPHPNPGRP